MSRILFMGTPAFAAAVLRELSLSEFEICGVFTQPDKEQNRGMRPEASEVKKLAVTLGIPVYQPETLRNGSQKELIEELDPDYIIVVAYGKILPEYVLLAPAKGCINVHGSLLPKYRGAAPIQRALIDGEKETGITIMHMDKGIDTGDMIISESVAIDSRDNTASLTVKMAETGGKLLLKALRMIEKNEAPRVKQDDAKATYASKITKEDGRIDWNESAVKISARIRGCDPWPCAEAEIDGNKLKLFDPELTEEKTEAVPGTILFAGKKGLAVACGDGDIIIIKTLQPQSKKKMPSASYFNGHPVKEPVIK